MGIGETLIFEIDHVQIAAPPACEREARAFFGELLGLTEIDKPEPLRSRGGCWFQVGARQLHIGIEATFRPSQKAHTALATRKIELLFMRLEDAGVSCEWDSAVVSPRRFYARDPWGNRIEFTEPTCQV